MERLPEDPPKDLISATEPDTTQQPATFTLEPLPTEPDHMTVESLDPPPITPLTMSTTTDPTPPEKAPAIDVNAAKPRENLSLVVEPTPPAPAIKIDQKPSPTELDADPTTAPTESDNADPKDKELGPTWFDALLLAIRSGVKLGTDLTIGIVKNWDAISDYIQNSPENTRESVKALIKELVDVKLIDPKIAKSFGNMLEKFKKIATELRAGPTDARKAALEGNESEQIIKDFLTEKKPDELPENPEHNTIQPTADSTDQPPDPKSIITPSLPSAPKPTPSGSAAPEKAVHEAAAPTNTQSTETAMPSLPINKPLTLEDRSKQATTALSDLRIEPSHDTMSPITQNQGGLHPDVAVTPTLTTQMQQSAPLKSLAPAVVPVSKPSVSTTVDTRIKFNPP